MTLTARPRLLIRFAVLAALAIGIVMLALSSTGSNTVGAQDGSAPAKPTGVVATATHDSVALAWDDPSDASITHYQIFRRDRDVHDTGEFVTIEENTGSAAASYTDDTVEPETRYVYRMKAVNQHGASTWSNFVQADTPAAPTPEPDQNSPATGQPTIGGTVEVGETLTADTSGIVDADGLGNAVFEYQWLAENTEVAGATGSTYTPVDADVGKTIKVRVSFTDDRDFEESLTSEATESVAAAATSADDGAIWSATMTVGIANGNSGFSAYTDLGELTPTGFTLNGTEYLVKILGESDGQFYFALNPDVQNDFRLHVGEAQFASEDASIQTKVVRGSVVAYIYQWDPGTLSLSDGDTVEVGLTSANTPATGAPTISGDAYVGETLTADVSAIDDADGLGNPGYGYQWVRYDETTDSDITGANSSTYTLVEDDADNAIKVRVSFTDDDYNPEELTSGATAAVEPAPLTTETSDEPESHNGTDAFTFRIAFSEDISISYTVFRDHSFETTNGSITRARRVNGSSSLWEITVEPDSDADVTVVLPVTTDCTAQGAVCTSDGRKLSNSVELTIAGPRGSGAVYTYEDSDRTLRVILQEDLVVRQTGSDVPTDRMVRRTAGGSIVRSHFLYGAADLPVFRSPSGGGLMTLPGGVLLALDPEWDAARVERFFVENNIAQALISERDYMPNGFFVDTEPGFPSLELANTLAAQKGVVLSIPNWWLEFEVPKDPGQTGGKDRKAVPVAGGIEPRNAGFDEAWDLPLDGSYTEQQTSISPYYDIDYFKLDLSGQAGTTDVRIYTTGTFNTIGALYDDSSERQQLMVRDNAFGSKNFSLLASLSPHVYYVVVLGHGGLQGSTITDTGYYTLHTETVTATALSLGSSVDANIDTAGEVDYFRLDLSGQTVTTDVSLFTVVDNFSLGLIELSYGSSAKLAECSLSGNCKHVIHAAASLSPGVYLSGVWGGSGATGGYTLRAASIPDHGSTTATATSLSLDALKSGKLTSASDAEYFKLVLTEAKALVIMAFAGVDVVMLDSGGTAIQVHIETDDDGFNKIIDDFESGTYYVKITATGASSYALYAYEDAYEDTCSAATSALADPTLNDPLYACQWHLNSDDSADMDINVESVWDDSITGEGINVVVVDETIDYSHPDLIDNIDSSLNHDYGGGYIPSEHHGTSVAGVIAARNNTIGVRGVAPMAAIYGYNLLAGGFMNDEIGDAMSRNHVVTAVSNNSWGQTEGKGFASIDTMFEMAIDEGVTEGYYGKGVFYVFAGGNGGGPEHVDNSNRSELGNYYGVTAVCAVGENGARSPYSEQGANLWICAPSDGGGRSIVTTENSGYTGAFSGTSAAAPIVSGVAALLRQANTDLTWRDLKLILAASARKNDSADTGWEDGARKYGSTDGAESYHFNHQYGFGIVDADEAVALAQDWSLLPLFLDASSESSTLDTMIPDNTASGITHSLTLDTEIDFIEFVEVEVSIDHVNWRELKIEMVSPSGATSLLAVSNSTATDVSVPNKFRFGSAKHLGEDPNGTWMLKVVDEESGNSGTFEGWSIKVYGHGFSVRAVSTGLTTATATVWLPNPDANSLTVYLRHSNDDGTTWSTPVDQITMGTLVDFDLTGLAPNAEYKLQASLDETFADGKEVGADFINRPAQRDIDTLAAAGNDEPYGLWSGGTTTTMWVGDYVDDKLYAYTLATRVRDSGKDFDTLDAAGNDEPSGIWSDGTTMWVADFDDSKLYAYKMSDKERDSGKDFDTLDAAGNDEPSGIWSDGATMWVADNGDSKLYAYKMSDKERDSGKDFDTLDAAGNHQPIGIWSDGATMWVADFDDSKLYAYKMSDKERDSGKDFDTLDAAGNDEPLGIWSDGATIWVADNGDDKLYAYNMPVNSAPAFASDTTTRSVAENTASGANVGSAVTATDADGDTLTYTLGGTDAASFSIVGASGQIQTSAALDYEQKTSYSVTVSVADGEGGTDTIGVTISVTDVNEKPATPGAPTVTATSNTTTSLDVSWTAPGLNGGPALTGYEVRYRISGSWIGWTHSGTGTSATITGLTASTTYDVQVRALNGETPSDWSSTGTGSTGTPANNAPEFSDGASTARSVAENTAASSNVGSAVTATDADGDTLTYSLGGTDAASFSIVGASGQIQTSAALDYEQKTSYSVTVSVADGEGGTDTIGVTISVTDVNEKPDAPGAPTVAATSNTTTSLDVSWSAPDTAGRPAISDYDVQYRKSGDTAWTDHAHTGTSTTTTIGSLDSGTTYQVQVRATNAEGTSGWSATGTGSTDNSAPAFASDTTTRSVAENTASGANVGSAVTATDADGDTLTYTLGGTDAASFSIVGASGQIQTSAALDYEQKTSYSVTVSVADGEGGTDTIGVTISVTDVNEKPATPGAPTVTATSNTTTSLDVSWTAPGLNGGPALTGYEVRYRISGSWIGWTHSGTGTSATITGLTASTTYDVQVRALNGETPSDWSSTGTGSTGTPANNAPEFSDGASTARSVAENTAASSNVGSAVTATDADGDTLTYTLGGTDAASFSIVGASGQILTSAALNYEQKTSYSVTVSVADGEGGTDTIAVTISVTDVNEKPAKPATPTVAATSGATDSLDVSWTAPGLNGGPALTGYEVRYRTGGGNWTDWTHSGTGTSATITGLTASTTYDVQVRALNGETPSDWSSTGAGSTGTPANNAPEFSDGASTARSVAENTASGANVGSAVTATDADGDTLTYSLGGTDAASFSIVGASGQIQTSAALDHETKSSYSVTVSVADGEGGTDTIAVTISVTDVNEKPAKPATPTVAATSGATDSLDVSWTAPGLNGGPAISDYDVQYRKSGDTAWTDHAHTGTSTTTTIGSLDSGTTYQVQVRATNAEGTSGWSATGTGSTLGPPDAPPNVQASGNAELTVTWDAPNDGGRGITGYTVQLKLSSVSGWPSGSVTERTLTGTPPARSHTFTGLTNGTVYTVRVKATNIHGDSDWSDEAGGTPSSKPPPSVTITTGADQPIDGPFAVTITFNEEVEGFACADEPPDPNEVACDIGAGYVGGALVDVVDLQEAGVNANGEHVFTARVEDILTGTLVVWVHKGKARAVDGGLPNAFDALQVEVKALDQVPQQPVTTVWQASMDVEDVGGYLGHAKAGGLSGGSLTGDTFTWSGQEYTVEALLYNQAIGEVILELSRALPNDGRRMALLIGNYWLDTSNPEPYTHTVAGKDGWGYRWHPVAPYLEAGHANVPVKLVRQAIGASSAQGQAFLSWGDPGDDTITGYRIERRDRDGDEGFTALVDDTGSDDTGYTDHSVEGGGRYAYRVTAMNDAGESEPSGEAHVDVPARPNSPARGAPSISGTAQVGETLTADTGGIEDDDGLADAVYSYQWLADDADISGATGETYTPAYDDQGKVIRVKVSFADDRDFEETLTSEPTEEVAEDPDAPTEPPNPPRTVRIVGDTNTSLTLTWDAPDGGTAVTEYRVQWLTVGENFGTARGDGREAVLGASARSHTITGLSTGEFYQVRVLAVNGAGESEGSNTAWGFPGLGEGQYGP